MVRIFSLARKPEGTSGPNKYLDLKQQYMHVILVHEAVNRLDTFVKLHFFVKLLEMENKLFGDSI